MEQEWREISGGRVRLRIMAGGRLGDDIEMLRLVRIGRLQAVAVSSIGLARIDEGVDALHIPLAKVNDRSGELESYKDKPIVIVCNMGQQAGTAAKQLRGAGFEKVYKMSGGMMEWNHLQLPTVSA